MRYLYSGACTVSPIAYCPALTLSSETTDLISTKLLIDTRRRSRDRRCVGRCGVECMSECVSGPPLRVIMLVPLDSFVLLVLPIPACVAMHSFIRHVQYI